MERQSDDKSEQESFEEEMYSAASDPLFLADVEEVMNDFGYADAEAWENLERYEEQNANQPLRLTLLSDTHSLHHRLPPLPEGDILIHAGDVSNRGLASEIHDFLHWFAAQPFAHKIFIAGNHDFFFERASEEEIAAAIPPGIHYLKDSSVTIAGLTFWGTPVTPRFFDWAFNRDRGYPIARHFSLIPENTDVLITHGPPAGILDEVQRGGHVGCEDLMDVVKRVKPKLHVFGHVHEGAGMHEEDGTTFINASVVDVQYRLVHPPRSVMLEAVTPRV